MASTAKQQKDKLHGPPRSAPRTAAASSARAARSATTRAPVSPLKHKAATLRSQPHLESTTDDKVNKISTNVIDVPNSVTEANVNEEHHILREINHTSEEFLSESTKEVKEEPNEIEGNSSETSAINELHDSIKTTAVDEYKTANESEMNLTSENEKGETEPSSKVSSRPQTPKSVHSNASRNPKVLSRPMTPSKPAPAAKPTPSRPHTPRQSALPRPKNTTALKSPVRPKPTQPKKPVANENLDPNDISTVFVSKQEEFHRLKKELDLKQQAILEIFNNLQNLRDRMIKEGKSGEGEGLNQHELMIFNVADWAATEVAQLVRNCNPAAEGAGEIIKAIAPIDDDILTEWDKRVLNLPGNFADLCLQAFTARQEVIDWVKEIIANQETINEEDLSRITIYNKQGLDLCEQLGDLKTQADASLQGITQLLKRACQERGLLITVGESLVKQIARLRQDITVNAAIAMEINTANSTGTELAKALEDTRFELEEERASKTILKDKLATAESQLRQTRLRVNKMDRQLREAEASIASLTMTVKSLEDQSRQKEVQLEARARKLKESLKTGEMTNNHVVQQRDALQTELNEMKEQLQRNVSDSQNTVQELNNKIKELKSTLEEERRRKQEEAEMKIMFEDSYRESLNTIEELKMQIAELESNKPNPDLPTEREMELRADLIATKDTLRATEEEIIACKREKVRFLETLTKITESDNKMGMQQKLAGELLSKEELISKMQSQIRELTKNIKLNEQKVLQYEQYVRDMQTCVPVSSNGQDPSSSAAYQELQQEIMNLRMGLLEAVHRNEELTEMLMQKEQQLEQQDKTSRAQVREELINMLQNKETEQSRELSILQQDLEHRMKIVDEVNKQIAAKAEEIQELFSTLESKQQQIHRLEKIVLALEEQQRRAQAQRTRHEEKIAALEHEIAAGGIRRERKFLFF
ncbi:PREDICTED: centrosomal protein of 290 kDa isoform X2 [Papilio xuthus]|uniref:Centrosomal protein of 290 kDa isoform X2 n=1 Tax=Papilio xuthus TaxID=66420 RepID=A0AAJ6ZMI4_PAPXU|nr:PREDICTED: centrosomal protein of 290 kDa isoform X2 [Papilio xuthus]